MKDLFRKYFIVVTTEIVVEAVTKENKVCPFLRSKNILSVVKCI